MHALRIPRICLLFIALTVVQLLLLIAVGAIDHVPSKGVVFMTLLLVGLARGSSIAWALLVLSNGIMLLAIGAIVGPGVIWANLVVMVLTGIAMEAVLFSPAMREHIGIRRRRVSIQ